VRFPESWSSTSLAKKAVPRHGTGYFRLDRAFSLIEGHPACSGVESGDYNPSIKSTTLTDVERISLSNQFRILAKLYPERAEEYGQLCEILERGYSIFYEEVLSVSDEMPLEECSFVFDVLNMFRDLKYQYDDLRDKAGIVEDHITFRGGDGNDDSKCLALTEYVQKEGKWKEILSGNQSLNSHSSTTRSRYGRMLERHNEIHAKHDPMSKWAMTKEEIQYIIG
jgi:uncharacterized protein YfbU (UPF0304 family)